MALSAGDIGAWFANVTTSVMIIFVNKLLMGKSGYGFNFAVTLSGLHYLAAALLMEGQVCAVIHDCSRCNMTSLRAALVSAVSQRPCHSAPPPLLAARVPLSVCA